MRKLFYVPYLFISFTILLSCTKTSTLISPDKVVKYGVAETDSSVSMPLYADFYFPKPHTERKPPLVVFVHGGGFISGTRNSGNIPNLCRRLADSGFVVSSIDYRLGYQVGNITSYFQALIRALEDLTSFLHFVHTDPATLQYADTTKIFLLGNSAGAATVLYKTFLQPAELESLLGNLKIEVSPKLFQYSADIDGVVSLWGAIGDTLLLDEGEPPVACIQAIADLCIPWDAGLGCQSWIQKTIYGSNSIHQRALHLGIPTALHHYDSDIHEIGIDSIAYLDTTLMFINVFFQELSSQK